MFYRETITLKTLSENNILKHITNSKNCCSKSCWKKKQQLKFRNYYLLFFFCSNVLCCPDVYNFFSMPYKILYHGEYNFANSKSLWPRDLLLFFFKSRFTLRTDFWNSFYCMHYKQSAIVVKSVHETEYGFSFAFFTTFGKYG